MPFEICLLRGVVTTGGSDALVHRAGSTAELPISGISRISSVSGLPWLDPRNPRDREFLQSDPLGNEIAMTALE